MFDKFLDELSTGWIWAAIPLLIVWLWRLYQQRFKKRYTKLAIFKVIHLRLKSLGHSPYYVRKHHSVEGVEEPVYDETWMINGTVANQTTLLQPILVTSSGFVDAYQILPSVTISKDIHPLRGKSTKQVEFREDAPTRSIAVVAILINGQQSEDQWWYATTAQYNEQDITLIVDFSSLPNASNLIKDVMGLWISKHPRETISPLAINRIGKDIFSVSQKNCRLEDVVKISFQLNMKEMKNISDAG